MCPLSSLLGYQRGRKGRSTWTQPESELSLSRREWVLLEHGNIAHLPPLYSHSQFPSLALSFLLWAKTPVLPRPGTACFSGTLQWAQDSPGCPQVPTCSLHCCTGEVGSLNHFTQTFANMEVHRLTHSVKPFHFRKYSTLPFRTRRRMILSTANSWTTAVSSVFLCLAVCFFLILLSMTTTRMAVHEHKTFCNTSLKTRHWCNNFTRFFFLFFARMCAGTMAQEGSQTTIRALIPAAPPDV